MDNLQLYKAREDEMTPAQKEVFPACFIGALSVLVPEGDWEIALNTARRSAQAIRPEHETTVRDVTHRRRS